MSHHIASRKEILRKIRVLFSTNKILKGIVYRDEYIVLKIIKIRKIVLSLQALTFLTILVCHASIKSVSICENPSSNPLQEAFSGFPIAACNYKSCSISHLWSRKPAMNLHWRKITNEREGKQELQFEMAFRTVFKISILKEASRKYYFDFSLQHMAG